MFFAKNLLWIAILASGSASAASLASTNFNGRTVGGTNNSTASNLNWTLNGLDDPGSMKALNAGGADQAIFDGTAFVQNIFAPGLNTGNGNTFWTTDISITVAAGFNVTLTDLTFNSISVNGGQVENVNRRNDYTAFLFDPSSALLTEITVGDTAAGNGGGGGPAGQPLVTLDFDDTVLGAGTHTLRIKGGDFVPPDETGNHTAIDNLSINGTAEIASVIPEPSTLLLSAFGSLVLALRRKR